MTNVLILGCGGMLSTMVVDFLTKSGSINIAVTYHKHKPDKKNISAIYYLDATSPSNLDQILDSFNPDYIINTIGIINTYCNSNESGAVLKAIKVNAEFPHVLSAAVYDRTPKCRIIQIATDCVFDGFKGSYIEEDPHNPTDVYGKSKSLGEVIAENFINIRCSIIGPEIYNHVSLLSWFLNQDNKKDVNGYTNHKWNGVTTLQFAELCHQIIVDDEFHKFRALHPSLHYVINETVSKFELLGLINSTFKKDVRIEPFETGVSIDRSLSSSYFDKRTDNMRKAIEDLYYYMKNSSLFGKIIS